MPRNLVRILQRVILLASVIWTLPAVLIAAPDIDSLDTYIAQAEVGLKKIDLDQVRMYVDKLRLFEDGPMGDKAKAYADMYEAHLLKRSNVDQSIDLASAALDYFEPRDDIYEIMVARMAKGNALSNAGKQKESIDIYLEAIALAESQKSPSKKVNSMVLRMSYNAGFSWLKYGNLDESARLLSYTRDLAEEIGDSMVLAHTYNQFGNVAIRREEYPASIEYNRKGLEITRLLGSNTGIYMEGAIGTAYGEMGVLDSAKYYLERVVAQRREGNNKYSLAVALINLSEVYRKEDNCKKSDEINQEIKDIAEASGQQHLYLDAEINLCICAVTRGDYNSAYQYYKNGAGILNDAFQYTLAADLNKCGAEAAEGLGHYKEALALYKEHKAHADSLMNEDSENAINELEKNYEIKRNEAAILALESEALKKDFKIRQRTYLFGIGVVLLALLAGVIYYVYRRRLLAEEQKRIDMERKLLRFQMNPHFIFNAISSIQNFLFDKRDLKVALTYLSKFAELMRQTLEHSREVHIPLGEEVASLKNYLELQQLRYQNKFEYELLVDDELLQDDILVPPLIAQPFVENAIEHGQIYRVTDGKVKISFKAEKEQIKLTVEDNGVGIRQYEIEKSTEISKKKSLATIITRERLGALSKQGKRKFDLMVEQLQNGGTIVTIGLPKMIAN